MHRFYRTALVVSTGILTACADGGRPLSPEISSRAYASITCRVTLAENSLACDPSEPVAPGGMALNVIVGGQNTYVTLAGSNVTYAAGNWAADITVQNRTAQPMGTGNGSAADAVGVRVFLHTGPAATGGTTGAVAVTNADGTAMFTAAGQPYFQYTGVLGPGATSSAKNWHFSIGGDRTGFTFTALVSAKLPDDGGVLRWINESNGGVTADLGEVSQANGEVWAVGTGGMIRHYNGSTWSTETSPVPGVTLRGVEMYGGTTITGLAVGDNSTILSYDGSWHMVTTTPSGGTTYTTLCRVGSSDYYIVGAGSFITHSTNPTNAASWQAQTSPVMTDFFTCGGAAANDVYASGLGGVILHNTGNGTWTQQTSNTTNALRAIAWIGNGSGELSEIWLTGASIGIPGIMLRSTGNGTWTPVSVPGDPVLRGLRPRDSNNPNDIFGVGYDGSITHYNGTSWSTQASGTPSGTQLNHIAFRSLSGGGREWWVVGNGGIILHGIR